MLYKTCSMQLTPSSDYEIPQEIICSGYYIIFSCFIPPLLRFFLFPPPILSNVEKSLFFVFSDPVLTSPWVLFRKTGSGEPVKSEFGATATCFVNFFDFCEIWFIFQIPFWRHHELNLEKRVRGSRSKANLEPRRPVSWTFLIFVKFCFFWLVAYVYMHLQLFVPFPGGWAI